METPNQGLRWLRTEWMTPVPFLKQRDESGKAELGEMQFLRAVRSDGQMFEVHGEVGPLTTPESLRRHLDSMLHDPAMPPYVDEETGEQHSAQVHPDFGKGEGNWIEEG
jgi:hypothetical protein